MADAVRLHRITDEAAQHYVDDAYSDDASGRSVPRAWVTLEGELAVDYLVRALSLSYGVDERFSTRASN